MRAPYQAPRELRDDARVPAVVWSLCATAVDKSSFDIYTFLSGVTVRLDTGRGEPSAVGKPQEER